MKDRIMFLISVLFLIFVILIFINAVKIPETPEVIIQPQRSSITFILGEDKVSDNPFYKNAGAYFRNHPDAQTDLMVDDVRSLNAMIQQLNGTSARSGRAFGEIHMVVHSNPWAGISMPLNKGKERITAEVIANAQKNGDLEVLNTSAVDSNTIIHIHACGLGKNTDLVLALSSALNNAQVQASQGYVNFTLRDGLAEMSEMDVFYAFYPTAYKPADLHLARQLKGRYPTTDLDWLQLLQKSSYRYNIPVEWEIKYPEYDVPEIVDEEDKMEWLMNQDELLDIIDETGIPFDNFRWRLKRGRDFIKVNGKVTVMCVMRQANVS